MLKLQNHGYRHHPYWYKYSYNLLKIVNRKYNIIKQNYYFLRWIVAKLSKTKVSGKILDHIGYWIPLSNYKTKNEQRSIVINKERT